MQLYNFTTILIDQVQDFEQAWAEQMKIDPENYPLRLDEGLWLEMFLIFLSTGEV